MDKCFSVYVSCLFTPLPPAQPAANKNLHVCKFPGEIKGVGERIRGKGHGGGTAEQGYMPMDCRTLLSDSLR